MITNIVDQLARDEGKKRSVYQDSKGYWTIGIGTCVDARKNCGLTDDEINVLLNNRIAEKKAGLIAEFPWMQSLDDARFGAVWNMSYQMGVEGVAGFHQFLVALQSGDYEAASRYMLESKWATEDSPARAGRLSLQIKTGVWQ